jgi:hypothetical protein
MSTSSSLGRLERFCFDPDDRGRSLFVALDSPSFALRTLSSPRLPWADDSFIGEASERKVGRADVAASCAPGVRGSEESGKRLFDGIAHIELQCACKNYHLACLSLARTLESSRAGLRLSESPTKIKVQPTHNHVLRARRLGHRWVVRTSRGRFCPPICATFRRCIRLRLCRARAQARPNSRLQTSHESVTLMRPGTGVTERVSTGALDSVEPALCTTAPATSVALADVSASRESTCSSLGSLGVEGAARDADDPPVTTVHETPASTLVRSPKKPSDGTRCRTVSPSRTTGCARISLD